MPDIFTAPKTRINTSAVINKTNEDIKLPVVTRQAFSLPGVIGVPGIFAALVQNPTGMTFAHQEKDEKILIFTRRHFFTNHVWILISLIAIFAPFIFSLLLIIFNIQLGFLSVSFTIVLLCFYYLIVFGYAFYNYCDWFYNIGIITQRRMIDIDFMHLSYINIAITQLKEIEDVVHKQRGFFSSFFDYGDVIAHTVATIKGKEDFIFESVPHPARVVDVISKLLAD